MSLLLLFTGSGGPAPVGPVATTCTRGNYRPTISVSGTYRATIYLTGTYRPTISVTGNWEYC